MLLLRSVTNRAADQPQRVWSVGHPSVFGTGCFRFNSQCHYGNIKLLLAVYSLISLLVRKESLCFAIKLVFKMNGYTNSGCSLLFIPISLSRLSIHVTKQLGVTGPGFFFPFVFFNHVAGNKHLSVKQCFLIQARC